MMTSVEEKITVLGVYEKSTFRPLFFRWQRAKYRVEQITLISDLRDGGVEKRVYSVVSQNTLYRLCFNRTKESWNLEGLEVLLK